MMMLTPTCACAAAGKYIAALATNMAPMTMWCFMTNPIK
jgi:hypothetical protein